MDELATDTGETVYVERNETRHGSDASFYLVYADPEGQTRWGYQCGNCETLDAAMDTMGRIVCNDCGNTRKPEEWDAAHE